MTFSRFFGFGFLLWLLLAVLKAAFLGSSIPLQVLFGILVFLVTLACSRRLGVINILEGGMAAAVWTVGILIADWLILDHIFHLDIFHQGIVWISYLIVLFGVFFGHKKRHIQIRQELAAHSHHH
jgi:hypothetical protein